MVIVKIKIKLPDIYNIEYFSPTMIIDKLIQDCKIKSENISYEVKNKSKKQVKK